MVGELDCVLEFISNDDVGGVDCVLGFIANDDNDFGPAFLFFLRFLLASEQNIFNTSRKNQRK